MSTRKEAEAKQRPTTRTVPACPWCGDGSELGVVGDGMGAVALQCTRCGARGPSVPMGADFNIGDEAAIAGWAHRQRRVPPPGLVERVRLAIGLHQLTATLSADAAIPVALGDLNLLLHAAGA